MIHAPPTYEDSITFAGYAHGTAVTGVRAHLLILNLTGLTEMAARRASAALPGSVLVSFPYGMGVVGEDMSASTRLLSGLARHPNAGAVVLVSADRTRLEQISTALAEDGRPYTALGLDAAGHDALLLSVQIMQAGAKLRRAVSARRRHTATANALCLAVECGLSDPTSGIAANRLIGAVTNRVVAAGGCVIMGETLEWLGVEDVLAARARTPAVAKEIMRAVARREALALVHGINLTGINPNRRNIEEGLSTIEEKASGAIAKSGTAPIEGVLAHGQAPSGPGLWLMDQPSYSPESLTGLAAAGAQIALFSTGSGNSYASALMPTIKITANGQTAHALETQIDFDCSDLMEKADVQAAAAALLEHIGSVASGTLTFGEILGEGSEAFSRFGEAL